MTVINSLGVNALSIRGAGTDYHRLSRVYESLAEANADTGFSATAGVEHVALIKGLGLAFYNHSTSQWEHTATEIEANVDDLISLTGIAENTTHLGTFSGTTIADNQTVKQALQALETSLEAVDIDTDDLAALTGISENITNLGTFTGSTIADNQSVKQALQALETSLETMALSATVTEIDANVDDLISLTGIAENTANLGTFSGSTIADSTTIKAALQALETKAEANATAVALKAPIASPAFTGTITAAQTGNIIPFYFDNQAAFPSATTYHGAIAHSHADAAMYYAHGGAWAKLANDSVVNLIEIDVNDLIALTGIAENVQNLGTFSGSTINDSVTIKTALQTLETAVETKSPTNSPTFTGTPAAVTAAPATSTTQLATTAFVQQEISSLIDSSPSALNTLNELAAALGDDANFSTTVTNLINANETHIDNMATLTGAAKDALHLGAFSGSTISDNQTIKAAIQALETKAEANTSSIATTQADVDTNEADADAAIALKAPLASPAFTGLAAFERGQVTNPSTNISDNALYVIQQSNGNFGLQVRSARLGLNVFTDRSNAADVLFRVGDSAANNLLELLGATAGLNLRTPLNILAGSDITLIDNTADALEVREGSNQYVSFDTTDSAEKVEVFKNVHLEGERLFFDSGSQLIRLHDNQTSALKIENHDGSSQDFLDFKTANSGCELIFGAPNQFNNTITVGVDDTGYDVKLFGATSGAYLEWDESANDLVFGGTAAVDFLAATTIDLVDNSSTALVIQQGSSEACITISTLDALPTITNNYRTVFNEDVLFVGAKDILMTDNTANALEIGESTNKYLTFDTTNSSELIHAKKDLVQNPAASVTPANNGELMVEATNNTTLTFKLKGSDGTVRSGTITLS
jgi:hypothetical protein